MYRPLEAVADQALPAQYRNCAVPAHAQQTVTGPSAGDICPRFEACRILSRLPQRPGGLYRWCHMHILEEGLFGLAEGRGDPLLGSS